MSVDRIEAQRIAAELEEPVRQARALAETLGLSPYEVNYWIVDHDEMNALIAYGGFQHRYPHWRWGMAYDRQRKERQFAGGKAFEIVNNDDPAHAFLQQSNAMADQKAVITHVEAHADFFANNEWFGLFADDLDAAAMLERHAERIESIMSDPEVDREAVERWIDHVLCLEDVIDQHTEFVRTVESEVTETDPLADEIAALDLSDEVRREVFDDEWLERIEEEAGVEGPAVDLLAFLRDHGMAFDEDEGKAVEFEEWQREVLDVLRTEAYYFAPQRMTKVMNEGWAAYWESIMMAGETFAGDDEFVRYADHQARVLGSPGLNPYKLGKELWEYVETVANRREVAGKLLRVEGVSWRNFHDVIDFDDVLSALEPPPELDSIAPNRLDDLAERDDGTVDHEAIERARSGDADIERYPWTVLTEDGMARRHFSLVKPQHRGALSRIGQRELERLSRYMFDEDRYATVEAALDDVDFGAGWNRMREVRESHNDVTFIDEFLTQEFVDEHRYFTYEYVHASGENRVTSTDYEDVKRKLLLQFTNFGKPTVAVEDGNFRNRGELLLAHRYNGVMLDVKQAKRVLERIFELWGRPVHLKTIVKELDDKDVEIARRRNREPEPKERGRLVSFDGDSISEQELAWAEVEDIAADDVDYDTKPEEWLA